MDEALKDKRFSHILKDPRFRKVPKNLRKIKVDKRFAGMFDKNVFNEKSRLDERGRALELTPAENLKKLYDTTNDSSEEEEEEKSNFAENSAKQSLPKEKISKISKRKLQLKKIKEDEEKKIHKQDSGISKDEDQLKSKNKFLKKKESNSSRNKIKASSVKSSESEDSDPEDCKDLDPKESEKSESEESEDSEENEDSESEESDSSSNETGSVQGDFDHHWEEFDEEAEMTEDISRRLAVCNMDWDRIRASDLFVVFNSFKPESGSICSVKIYPSEFGLKRMEEEKLKGPPELVEKTLASDEEEDMEDKKGAKYNQEKLRQYQINRLKYHYAVVECDTPETANHLYEQLNGLEYESSSVRFDLRFVPDDTTFDQEPTSVADSSPDPTEYKPRLFVTTALQQVKVNLTWDETNPQRRETLQKAFTDLDSVEKDLKDYLASSSSEESEDEVKAEEDGEKLSSKERIAKYRALLLNLEEKEKKDDENDKEITWDPDVKEKTKQVVKEKMDSTSSPFDEILKKKKERRQKKQKEKKKGNNEDKEISSDDSELISDEESSKKNIKQLAELQLISDAKEKDTLQEKKKGKKFKKKKKEQKKDEFKVDVTDPRFSAIYTHHDYNIDPSDPHFKPTEGTLAFMREKKKQRLHEKDLPEEERNSKKMKHR